jgi:hypothetical protein
MEGSLGYAWRERDATGETDESWVGSFGLLHIPTGLNGQIAAGAEVDGGNYGYVKLGYRADFFEFGSTNFSVDYYGGSDFECDGSRSESVGVQAVQRWDDAGIEGYLGWRSYAFEDDNGVEYRDASSVLAGMRWRF